MNRLTAARGFFSPQSIVVMDTPKSFKTDLMLKIEVELVVMATKCTTAIVRTEQCKDK